ncbi:hypothetical protein M758_3G184500 [Ceratodon purpureus]|nr:hypothetical protein M758_3G184500 [Ceratodon purpureus]
MPLFTARARPRPARLSTSSISSLKNKDRQMCMYLYMLGVALLLVISVSLLQLGLGGSPADPVLDARHARKGASGAGDLRVHRHKGEFGAGGRQEKYKDIEKLSRRKRAEMFNSRNRSKDWKARSVGKRGVGIGMAEEEEEAGSQEKEVPYFSDFEGREVDLNDMDDLEEQSDTEDSRIYQGQQLDDMDKFDKDEVKEDAYKHQGQLLDDMDRFDNHQVTQDTNKHMFGDDAVPKFVEELSRNRKFQTVGGNRPDSQGKGSPSMSENETLGHLQDGKKESRKLGFRRENSRDVLNKEREDAEQEDSGKLSHSIGDSLGSEDIVQPANAVPEAPKGSIRAAIEQEMEKRNGALAREARDSLRRSLGETNFNPASLHGKNKSEDQEGSVETGMPPLRVFKEFFDDMKVSHDNGDKPMDKSVVQEDVKGEEAVILDKSSSKALRSPPWNIQTTVEDVVVDSLSFPNVKENMGDVKESSRSAQETAEINNLDSVKLNALTMEERTSMDTTRFDHVVNPKLNVEVSEAREHLESADVLQTDKQLIKEDHVKNVGDVRNEGEEKAVSRNADKNGSAVEEIEVEGERDPRKTNINDSAVEVKEVQGERKSRKSNEKDSAMEENEDDDHDNMIQWGFYPTLSTKLKFSKFLSAFFKQESCSLRIFMAWTTAPWAYTPRHQRAIESILHFHPQACIVVFTETIDFQFFDSWVKEGYKIAVARPNLEELLGKTPAIDFAYVWYEWRNMNLFYIHYTELLRIAALHKYGGVWLDMDMILARPLPKLHNVLGSTVSEDGEWVLNGAFMSFDKSSYFLKACIEEFVATYDETSLGWNGADLLNRVASNATRKGGKVWLEQSEHLQVLEPIAFFPLSRHSIIKYFSAPKNNHERVEQKQMLSAILDESHGTHLWNSVTGRHVPEVGSLVEKLLNRFCMRCTDVL